MCYPLHGGYLDDLITLHDPVNHPAHYTTGRIECIDAIREALGLDDFVAYCRGAAIKYAWRAPLKANAAEDLRKGAWYLSRAAVALEMANGADARVTP